MHYGFGRNFDDLPAQQLIQALKWYTVDSSIFFFSTMCIRISTCLFLLRLFVRTARIWKYCVYFILLFNILTQVSLAIVIFFQCQPMSRIWDLSIAGHCWALTTRTSLNMAQSGKSFDYALVLHTPTHLVLTFN